MRIIGADVKLNTHANIMFSRTPLVVHSGMSTSNLSLRLKPTLTISSQLPPWLATAFADFPPFVFAAFAALVLASFAEALSTLHRRGMPVRVTACELGAFANLVRAMIGSQASGALVRACVPLARTIATTLTTTVCTT